MKKAPVPSGGMWFTCQDEAMTHGCILIELQVEDTLTWYGVYPTQAEFCLRATAFIKKRPCAVTAAQLKSLVSAHTEIPRASVKKMGLSEEAQWFMNELGALTAFDLRDHAHFARLLLRNNRPDFNPRKIETYTIFYGIFNSSSEWFDAIYELPERYILPMKPPYTTNTLEYDRCRCTVLRARNALIRPPKLNKMIEAEMEPYVNLVPPALFWFRTKEDALDMAGFTVEYRLKDAEGTTLYGVYTNLMEYACLMELFSEREASENRRVRQFTSSLIQDPTAYETNPDDE